MELETKECRRCLKLLPLKNFEKKRAVCRACIQIQKAEATLKKASRNQDAEPQESVINEDSVMDKIQSILGKEKTDVQFQSREQAEEFIANDLMSDIATLNALADLYEELANTATNKKDKKEYAAKLETVTQKKIDLKLKLIKSFDFFSDLAKPESEDPLYTPVHIYLNTQLPSECIIEPKFKPDADEVQELDNESSL